MEGEGWETLEEHGPDSKVGAWVVGRSLADNLTEDLDAPELEAGLAAGPVGLVAVQALLAVAVEEDEDMDGIVGSYWDGRSEPSAAGEKCIESAAVHWGP